MARHRSRPRTRSASPHGTRRQTVAPRSASIPAAARAPQVRGRVALRQLGLRITEVPPIAEHPLSLIIGDFDVLFGSEKKTWQGNCYLSTRCTEAMTNVNLQPKRSRETT